MVNSSNRFGSTNFQRKRTDPVCFVFGHSVTHLKPLECAKGQSYWCQNITTAASCSAVKHCIQGVWELEVPIEADKSEVCQICLDMVKQARDQLESNETQTDIKTVLEASCKVIPMHVVREDCIKLMDDFAADLIDTLASQMNPQVVCSVAGLCNNNRVHRLEEEYYRNKKVGTNELNCNSCNTFMDLVERKLKTSEPGSVHNFFLELCGHAGSYSDSCASVVTIYKDEIQAFLLKNANSAGNNVCSLVGVCKEKYHNHKNGLVRVPISHDSVSTVRLEDGDVACDFCVQMVGHLRDILIANSSKDTFKLVLTGICNQMTAYKEECLHLVSEYYEVMYDFLVEELNGPVLCKMVGLCHPSSGQNIEVHLRPLIYTNTETVLKVGKHVGNNKKIELPIELLNPLTLIPSSFINGGPSNKDHAMCAMCEYFLHFVQQEVTLPSSERAIQKFVMKGCSRLPETISAQCNSFVQTYMDDFIALFANEIDPSQVCPKLGVCPGDLVFVNYEDKPSCPLCLLAMEEILHKVKNSTLTEVSDIVDDVCLRDQFPDRLLTECAKFISSHRQAIIEMVLAEFTAQESCVFVDVCVPPSVKNTDDFLPLPPLVVGHIETNEISEEPTMSEPVRDSNTCVLCEFIMTKIDAILKENKTEEEIKHIVLNICRHLPKTISPQCENFVAQYADLVITLLAEELDPKQVCTAINLCDKVAAEVMKNDMKECLVCELLMDGLRGVFSDRVVDDDINKNLIKACHYLPKDEQSFCVSLIGQIAPQVETALRTLPVGPLICKRIRLCSADHEKVNSMTPVKSGGCFSGAAFWCQSTMNAAACGTIEYCQKNVWKGDKPRRSHNKGRIVIKY